MTMDAARPTTKPASITVVIRKTRATIAPVLMLAGFRMVPHPAPVNHAGRGVERPRNYVVTDSSARKKVIITLRVCREMALLRHQIQPILPCQTQPIHPCQTQPILPCQTQPIHPFQALQIHLCRTLRILLAATDAARRITRLALTGVDQPTTIV